MPTAEREFTANVRFEEGAYWAEVAELPGCFASGIDLNELNQALIESIQAYLAEDENGVKAPPVSLSALRMVVSPS
jgi:predicted RNase H-like HicB family nuclease